MAKWWFWTSLNFYVFLIINMNIWDNSLVWSSLGIFFSGWRFSFSILNCVIEPCWIFMWIRHTYQWMFKRWRTLSWKLWICSLIHKSSCSNRTTIFGYFSFLTLRSLTPHALHHRCKWFFITLFVLCSIVVWSFVWLSVSSRNWRNVELWHFKTKVRRCMNFLYQRN